MYDVMWKSWTQTILKSRPNQLHSHVADTGKDNTRNGLDSVRIMLSLPTDSIHNVIGLTGVWS